MIEPNSLRIGNLVRGPKGIEKVWDVMCDMVNTDKGERLYEDLEPLPITDEILLEMGFEEDDSNFWFDMETHHLELRLSSDYYYPIYVQDAEMSHEDEQRVCLNRVKFIHELQNLFFVLTGKELKYKD